MRGNRILFCLHYHLAKFSNKSVIMPTNVEIKAKVANLEELKSKAASLSDSSDVLVQEDTFFVTSNGRLKLREQKSRQSTGAELVYYEREDTEGPKSSHFVKTPIPDPSGFKETLRQAIGIRGVVKKTRYLFMVGQTRVHVDQVNGLGDFMELEVMKDGQSLEEGQAIAEDLMQKLGIDKKDLVTGAYMDHLEKTE
ncbi:uncharacterized protein LOC106168620 [Lingula anatina]|uniref:Uncharacterized protein LOC106168620 n=1 Tax=Lingula anatina TaxID=7574 RepID=A0A1S3IYD8_LINAN|nr:uncharacterized protein LOC106168620 [Lingula anatina]|eukprot:XP_013403217.1 uncharacterized protein LOC106168620 [Lingula anatina]